MGFGGVSARHSVQLMTDTLSAQASHQSKAFDKVHTGNSSTSLRRARTYISL